MGWRGTRRLVQLVVGSPVKQVVKGIGPRSRLALQFNPDGEIPDLVADCVDAVVDELIAAAGGPPRTEAAFTALVASVRAELPSLTADAVRLAPPLVLSHVQADSFVAALPGILTATHPPEDPS